MKAKDFAEKKHEGQFRFGGKIPYFIHPSNVADLVKQFTDDQEVIAAAYLHDTLEDTPTTYEELVQEFSPCVAALVLELTSSKEEIAKVGKAQYLLNKMLQMSPEALLVKLADRWDNTTGLAHLRPSFAAKYSKETEFILNGLDRPLTNNHRAIIAMIRNNLQQ